VLFSGLGVNQTPTVFIPRDRIEYFVLVHFSQMFLFLPGAYISLLIPTSNQAPTPTGKERDNECKGDFNLITQNVRGLREKKKRIKVFENLKKKKAGIALLQEAHCTKEIETLWKSEWGGDIVFSHGASNSTGVMILFPSGFDITINKTFTDNTGRFIILSVTIQDSKYLLYNVYAPNTKNEHKIFLEELKKTLEMFKSEDYDYVIGGGDWNFTEYDIDRSGGNYTIWQENCATLTEITEKLDIIDIWRVRNPEERRYTFRQKKGGRIIQARLDRLYISDTLQYNVSNVDITPSISSDHLGVVLSIRPIDDKHQNGSSYWKFNNSLLKNKVFTANLKNYIANIKVECNEIVSKQVCWEYLKFKIKTECIKQSKILATARRKEEKELEEQILFLEKKLGNEPTEQLYDTLHDSKAKLEKIHDQKTQSLLIQSRVQHYEEGEKSTKFFLNQIKPNKRKSTIRKLIVVNDDIPEEVSGQKEIMNELKSFYSNLYSEKSNSSTGDWIKNLKQKDLIPQLSPEKNADLAKKVTIEQFEETMKICAKTNLQEMMA